MTTQAATHQDWETVKEWAKTTFTKERLQEASLCAATLGIIGTVLGLIHTLGSTSDAERMATAIAGAFIATLWGVALANLCYLPISDKLKLRHEEELANLDLIMEGVIAIQSGDNPRIVKTKLLSFISPHMRDIE